MADEDEIDIEGDFEFKIGSSDSMSGGVYDSELPSHSVNLLPEFTQPSWMLDQAWCLDHLDDKSKVTVEKMLLEEQQYVNGQSPSENVLQNPSDTVKKTTNRQPWTEEEKTLFLNGIDIFGRRWSKISELLPNRTHLQVKNFAQQYFKARAKQEQMTSHGNEFTENLIHVNSSNSLQDAIAAVTTGKPTISLTSPFKSAGHVKTWTLSKPGRPKKSPQRKSPKGSKPMNANQTHQNKTKQLQIGDQINDTEIIVIKKKSELTDSSDDEIDIDVEDDQDQQTPQQLTSSDAVYQKLLASAKFEDCENAKRDAFEKQNIQMEDCRSNLLNSNTVQSELTLSNPSNEQSHQNNNMNSTSSGEFGNVNDQSQKQEVVDNIELKTNSGDTKSEDQLLINQNLHKDFHMDHDYAENPNDRSQEPTPESISSEHSQQFVDDKENTRHEAVERVENVEEEEDCGDCQDSDLHENENAVLTSSGEVIYLSNPAQELIIDKDSITEAEKSIHSEFFEGRMTKTPERYLKIRNFIIDSWLKIKPSYLNKTGLRSGLKNCGDVNCIGRIHAYLEQIGAINFGCESCGYNRPNKIKPTVYVREKLSKEERKALQVDRMESMRPRKRRVRDIYGDWVDEKELEGKTISHTQTYTSKSAPVTKASRNKDAYDPFKLIPCVEFSSLHPAPFILEMSASAMAVMDIHSHLSKTEVIGLLGGRFIKEQGKLEVLLAEPCHSLSTGMQCEMDPVSQSQSSEKIQLSGCSVVGWYHSHPSFVPNPSVRDLETQEKYQSWLCRDGCPFIGCIVSPYNHQNQSLHSQTKCLIAVADSKTNPGSGVPYQFDFAVVGTGVDRLDLLTSLKVLAEKYIKDPNHVDLLNFYKCISNITCLEKMLQSVGRYLEMEGEAGSLLLEDLKNTLTVIFSAKD